MSDTAVIPLGLEGFARPPSITFLSHLYGAVSTSSDPSAQNLSCSVYMTGSQCPMRRFVGHGGCRGKGTASKSKG
eukprot:scaffold20856_cov27-Tisochrysis_lutea.AAC.1